MIYETHMAAMNAAKKQLGKGWKDYAKIEKVADRQFSIQMIQIEQAKPAEQEVLAEVLADAPAEIEQAEPEAEAEAEQEQLATEQEVNPEPEAEVSAEEWAALIEKQKAEADEQANAQSTREAQLPNGKPWFRFSTIEKPTKMVHVIADWMYEQAESEAEESGEPVKYPSRKEVQAECERQGIASGTARTQYQVWKTAKGI